MNIYEEFTQDDLDMYFEFLDDLRESGETNMFGAGPYLQDAYSLNKKEAKAVVLEWMETFGERHPQH